MNKALQMVAVVFALAVLALAFLAAVYGIDHDAPFVPHVPSAPTTAPAPTPTVTATTVVTLTAGQVRP